MTIKPDLIKGMVNIIGSEEERMYATSPTLHATQRFHFLKWNLIANFALMPVYTLWWLSRSRCIPRLHMLLMTHIIFVSSEIWLFDKIRDVNASGNSDVRKMCLRMYSNIKLVMANPNLIVTWHFKIRNPMHLYVWFNYASSRLCGKVKGVYQYREEGRAV